MLAKSGPIAGDVADAGLRACVKTVPRLPSSRMWVVAGWLGSRTTSARSASTVSKRTMGFGCSEGDVGGTGGALVRSTNHAVCSGGAAPPSADA